MRVLENLEPQKVFYYFEEICNIPHGSGNLDGISSYLEKFAKDRNLFCIRDNSNNIIIVKEATSGYEKVEPIILQGHMDMVAVKKAECDIDLCVEPLRLRVDGDFIYAEGTSLGGDDGIAVAYILAIMDSNNIEHPRIEAVITTDEEIGMLGAAVIDLSILKSKRMLNIDSEEEGILLAGCAGGMRVDTHIPVKREIRNDGIDIMITIEGLKGGHSGTEINKERGNAIKILGLVLKKISEEFKIQIADVSGGEKDNAIPRNASAILYIEEDKLAQLKDKIIEIENELKNEYSTKEKDFHINIKELAQLNTSVKILDRNSTINVIDYLLLAPNGIISMSADMEGLVETSLNIGILGMKFEELIMSFAVRSSIETAKRNVKLQIETLTKLFGGKIESFGEYPGWQFDPNSKLRAKMLEIYKKMFGEEVKVEAIHAGLECGMMISKIPELDCVSFGPNIFDIHTTEEKLSISSARRMWDYLIEILKQK